MKSGQNARWVISCILIFGALHALPAPRPSAKLVKRVPDPNGIPRPFPGSANVPLRTSLFLQLAPPTGIEPGPLGKQVTVSLAPHPGSAIGLLRSGEGFVGGARGWIRPSGKTLSVYIEPPGALKPMKHYTVRVTVGGANAGSWEFMTGAAPSARAVHYRLDLGNQPIRWHGHFFDGICNVIFCSRATNYGPTYRLMRKAHARHPRAWRLRRDFWLTGTDYQRPHSGFFPSNLPNIVRERETRRIVSMQSDAKGVVLRVKDVFGHQEYGIPSNRPVGRDYHRGDEVLIADGFHDARAKVLDADSAAGTVTIGPIATPAGGWKIAYAAPLPRQPDPDAPGLFPPGGCNLRKYNPPGTPCYYWGRLDKEWDLARRNGWRLVPNFADAPADLSRDGRSWTTVKNYDEWHAVVRRITSHIIKRYGRNALDFTWSIFNEPDLRGLFWRSDWTELQKYYDYTSDAVLRAFEDQGYDSSKVMIGGLELGAIFGTNFPPLLRLFLAHCSPWATAPNAEPLNAAFADPEMEGKRSHRVEALCHAHAGRGSPVDFISIHSYDRSAITAAKLGRARETALKVDPDYYKRLWVNSDESCPNWLPPPDDGAGDMYRGDGYFATWCADVVHRQLLRAVADPRFARGETILTVWPPPSNFAGVNAMTQIVSYHDGKGAKRTVTVAMPIFHFLNRLSDLGPNYWVLPTRREGGHVIGGFASRDKVGVLRILLYTHDWRDTQSRSDDTFDVTLEIAGLGWAGPATVREVRFDRDHNSPYHLIKSLAEGHDRRGGISGAGVYTRAEANQIRRACEVQTTSPRSRRESGGGLEVMTRIEGNGCSFLVIRPAKDGSENANES